MTENTAIETPTWGSYMVCLPDVCKSLLKVAPDAIKGVGVPGWIVDRLRDAVKAQNTFNKALPMLEEQEKSLAAYVEMLRVQREQLERQEYACWHVVQNAERIEKRARAILGSIAKKDALFSVDKNGDVRFDKNRVMRVFNTAAFIDLLQMYNTQASVALLAMQTAQMRLDVANSIADEQYRNQRRSILKQTCASERDNPILSSVASAAASATARQRLGKSAAKPRKHASAHGRRKSTVQNVRRSSRIQAQSKRRAK